jgi:hypothetical protein
MTGPLAAADCAADDGAAATGRDGRTKDAVAAVAGRLAMAVRVVDPAAVANAGLAGDVGGRAGDPERQPAATTVTARRAARWRRR